MAEIAHVQPPAPGAGKQETAGHHVALNRVIDALNAESVYLGDQVAVDAVLRVHIGGVMERWQKVARQQIGTDQALAADKAMAAELASIFLGQVEGYQSVGPWNDDGQIAQFCAERLGLRPDVEPISIMTDAFALLLQELYAGIQMLNDQPESDDWQTKIDGAIEDWTYMLLGLPPPQ